MMFNQSNQPYCDHATFFALFDAGAGQQSQANATSVATVL
jgi:hypothetical protein